MVGACEHQQFFAAGWRPCAEQARERAMCAPSVSVSPCWRELWSLICQCASAGVSCCSAPPLRLHSRTCICWDLSESPPRIATSQQLAILRQVHLKAELVFSYNWLVNTTFVAKNLRCCKCCMYLLAWKKSETKLLDIFVCYTHIVIALHSNSHNFKVGERIFFWQPYLLF